MSVEGFWQTLQTSLKPFIAHFSNDEDDLKAILADSDRIFTDMAPDLPYADNPAHVMAGSMFYCAAMLAYFKALEPRGVDTHQFGSTMLEALKYSPKPEGEEPTSPGEAMVKAAEDSQAARPGEFVFEVYEAVEGEDFDWGMNIKACGICQFFSKYDAMDLVPYMCASDDVISDIRSQGLSRTGTIALGAGHCDFKFNAGGTGHHLSAQYPDRIKVIEDFKGF